MRTCDSWAPSDIDASKWTHLNYAFALIDENTFEIAQMNDFDKTLYAKFTDLKGSNSALKVFISIGGWDAGGAIFSSMVSTSANRAAFIASAQKFMKTYAFDGIDIDWEYPVADDRGGTAADKENFVTFLSELRDAVGNDYGITATLPSSYWYLQNFDIAKMEPYLDWFNMMTYDIHGTWDGTNPYTEAVVAAHTNLTEINDALDLLWRNNIDSSKVVLGLGFYGRSFTLSDPSCSAPGCAFSGGANPGECTANSGTLSYSELQAIISENNLTPVFDEVAAVKYITWDSDQWASYDDSDTFKLKLEFANSKCLGGTMAWALDLDTATGSSNSAIDALVVGSSMATGLSLEDAENTISMKSTLKTTNTLSLGLFWTACLPPGSQNCPTGYQPVVYGHGKVFDADLNHISGEGCHGGGRNGFNRVLCAENSMKFSCQWGPGKTSKACNSKCPSKYLTLTKNSHIAGQSSGCKSGKYAPVCCDYLYAYHSTSNDICAASYASQQLSSGLSLKSSTTDSRSYDYSGGDDDSAALAKHRKLKAKRAATQEKRELKARRAEASADSNELMALSPAPRKRVIDTGAACGDVLAADQIGLDVPAMLIQYTIGGSMYYSFSATATNTKSSPSATNKPTRTIHTSTRASVYSTDTRTCDGTSFPQACMHYSSVISVSNRYSLLTCSDNDVSIESRPIVSRYNRQHDTEWIKSWIASSYTNPKGHRTILRPQRDEFPPNHFNQGVEDGYIRLLASEQNSGAANKKPKKNGWKGFCKFPPNKEVKTQGGPVVDMGNSYEVTIMTSTIVTLSVMSYTWTSVSQPAGDEHGITLNNCWPSVLTADPGFALLTGDPWYNIVGRAAAIAYKDAPVASLTNNKNRPNVKRSDAAEFVWDAENKLLLVNEGNSTRLADEDEIREVLGMHKCATADCAAELAAQSALEARMGLPTQPAVPTASSITGFYVESETTMGSSSPYITAASQRAAASKPSLAVSIVQPTTSVAL